MQPMAARERSARVEWFDRARDLASTDEIDAHVGSRLRARRTELSLSQAIVGRHLGLTFSQVQKYEKGSNRIGAGRLYHLTAILGVSVPYFFEGLEASRPLLPRNSEPIAAAEAARLQEVFVRISDPQARKALLSLASSMVKDKLIICRRSPFRHYLQSRSRLGSPPERKVDAQCRDQRRQQPLQPPAQPIVSPRPATTMRQPASAIRRIAASTPRIRRPPDRPAARVRANLATTGARSPP